MSEKEKPEIEGGPVVERKGEPVGYVGMEVIPLVVNVLQENNMNKRLLFFLIFLLLLLLLGLLS